jgi:DMSO/TMAO reductase YedYZ heme-binding membrane subunit
MLKNKYINGWWLFWPVAVLISVATIVEMSRVDVSTGAGVSHMIAYSVRFAVPLIFLIIAASSMQKLFPGALPTWWLRNRKYLGLLFAVAMAWQGLFIFAMSVFFRDYYYEDIYLLRDELEGSVGYIFLAAMVVTSFKFGRQWLNKQQWNLLHTSGVYFLWAYPFSVYWWNLSYYANPQPVDYFFYWSGFLAFGARIAAWGKQRRRAAGSASSSSNTPLHLQLVGGAIIGFGLLASATGLRWQDTATTILTTPEWSAILVLWLPFWPFEPFLSLFIIGLGTMLATTTRPSPKSVANAVPNP